MGYAVWPRLFKEYFIQLLSLMLQYACLVPSKILCLFCTMKSCGSVKNTHCGSFDLVSLIIPCAGLVLFCQRYGYVGHL